MDNWVIKAENISKQYSNGKERFRADISESWGDRTEDKIYALKDVTFDLQKGEILGIIGKNGAGKSTLLRILSAITKPTTGKVRIKGKVGSMLEMGAGFSPDLTGRENIFLTGSLIGVSKKTVAAKIDEIITVSGLKEHIDKPVKHYSSGMHIRLAFSSLTILETDILILDEISAVGDAGFRMKSSDVIRQLSKSGRSIVLASHNLEEIQTICNKVLWLDEGAIKFFGDAAEAIENYMIEVYSVKNSNAEDNNESSNTNKKGANSALKEKSLWYRLDELPTDDTYKVTDIQVHATAKGLNDEIFQEDAIEIDIVYEKLSNADSIDFIVYLSNSRMVNVLTDCDVFRVNHQTKVLPAGRYKITTVIPGRLLNVGMYAIHLAILKNETELVCDFVRIKSFRIQLNTKSQDHSKFSFISHYTNNITSAIRPDLEWKIEKIK